MKAKVWVGISIIALGALIIAFTSLQPTRAQGPFYVAPGGDDDNPCTSAGAPCATIDGAIPKASYGDTIYVAVGTYTGTGSQVVWIDLDITLSGGWDASFGTQVGMSTVDGEGMRKGISLGHDIAVVIERFAIQNGWQTSSGSAGGIGLHQGTLTLNNCTVTNSGFRGVFNDHGTLTLNQSVVADNSDAGIANGGTLILNDSIVSGNGFGISNGGGVTLNRTTVEDNQGGIRSDLGATMSMEDSTVRDNAGTGIHSRGVLTLTNSIVSRNSGGGINNDWNGVLVIRNSVVEGNTAGDCAGISNSGFLTLTNSTISGNTADQDGGGICNDAGLHSRYDDGVVVLNNSTVAANTAAGRGGGIYNVQGGSVDDPSIVILNSSTLSGNSARTGGGGIYNSGTITLQNTILAGNTTWSTLGPDCSGVLDSLGYNLVGNSNGCILVPGAGDLVNASPQLGHLIGMPSYYPLLPSSPAINAGSPAGCTDHLGTPLNNDQRGADRLDRCDIGAYEYAVPGPATLIYALGGTPQSTPPDFAFRAPLRAMVLDSIGSPVHNVTVAFHAPASGASGTFADSGTFTTTAVPNGSGIATAATFTANELLGSYHVTATVAGVLTPTVFSLTNAGWYVAPSGSDANDCQSPTTPCATINAALAKTGFVAGDTVLVASGVYVGTGDEVVLLDKSARLLGGWDGTFAARSGVSAIDGERARRCMAVAAGVTAHAERFVLQNAFVVEGGGVYNEGALDLTGITIRDNSSCFGAGLWNQGTLTAFNITISENVCDDYTVGRFAVYNASSGGMILDNAMVSDNLSLLGVWNYGMLTMTDSTVRGNWDERESGTVGNWGGAMSMDRCTISDNTAEGDAGIIVGWDSTTIVENSTVSGNIAHSGCGGGVSVDSGVLTMINTTISGNTASLGAGICNEGGALTLNNTTVSGNTATGYEGFGGGIHNDQGTVTLRNSILAGNAASSGGPDCSGAVGSAGYNLVGDVSGCSFSSTTGDQLGSDPALGPLEGSPGYHPVRAGSPAVNAGDPAGCTDHVGASLPFDQRGMPRVGRCDIGAYEAGLVATKQVRGITVPGGSVSYTITMYNEEGITDLTGVVVTDTLPVYHTYVPGSFSATHGAGSESNGVITWSGTIPGSEETMLTFGARISDLAPRGIFISNTAVISSGGVAIERQVAFDMYAHVYLPVVTRNYCGRLLYADDFSDPASGWHVGDSGNVLYAYLDGEYRMLLRKASIWASARPGFKATDYTVAVDVRHAPGAGLGSYGLIFGLSDDWSQFYSFEILPHGMSVNYALYRYSSGSWVPLAVGFSGSIHPGDATNRIKIVRDGTLIQAYANGQLLESLQDSTYTGSRHVGLIASSYDQANVDARFDNFAVYPASCGPYITALEQTDAWPSIQLAEPALPAYQEGTRTRQGR